VPHYFPTCGGVASSATELTAVLANLVPVGASWRVLCSYRSSFEGGGIVVGCPAAVTSWFEGAVKGGGGPCATQWRSWWRPVPVHSNSVGNVVTVPGVTLQWRGWPHRVDSDGEDRSRRRDVTA
jgi:hypothetical protein